MIGGSLIAWDKQPGFQPVGVKETWCCLTVKCVLRISGQDLKAERVLEHMAVAVEAGTEDGIHAMHLHGDHLSQ